MENIGDRIKNLMKQNNMTQKKLSEEIGMSRAIIGNYINGLNFPNSEALAKLSKLFQVSTDYLIFGDEQVSELIETKLIECFRELNTENQLKVVKEATGLREVQRLQDSIKGE